MKLRWALILFFFSNTVVAQTFELDQVEQLWRPRIRADFRYLAPTRYKDTSAVFSSTDQSTVFTFPVKTKLSTELSLDLSSLKLKDILKNSVSLTASQLMGSLKFGAKQLHAGIDSVKARNLYYAYGGVVGLKLTKNFKLLFYSLNAGFSEQDKTITKSALRANGVIGKFRIKSLRKNYYYGIAASYGDGLFLPLPFFGGTYPLGDKSTMNYTLPAQVCYQYKPDAENTISAGINIDGYRYGLRFKNQRIRFNYGNVNVFANYKYKLTKLVGFRAQGGYNFIQGLTVKEPGVQQRQYPLRPGFYIEVGVFNLFGKNLFDKITDSFSDKQ